MFMLVRKHAKMINDKQTKDKKAEIDFGLSIVLIIVTMAVYTGDLKSFKRQFEIRLMLQLCTRNYDLKDLNLYFYLLCFLTVKLVVFEKRKVLMLKLF